MMIDKHIIVANDTIFFDLYAPDVSSGENVMALCLAGGTRVDAPLRARLLQKETLYIDTEQKALYQEYVEKHLQRIARDRTISMDEKTKLIYSVAADTVDAIYKFPDLSVNADRSMNIVRPILDTILSDEKTIVSYIKILEHDYYTHTHCLNVGIYAMSLGNDLGLEEEELVRLGQSGLLHDLGKSHIDNRIINKNGKLDSREFEIIKEHPELGYEIALQIGISDSEILDAIRHHHEKLDGVGYPDALNSREISLFPRIVGICDIFDALTTRRSYKNPLNSFDALHLMKTQMHDHLDMSLVDRFIRILHD
jgi:putative nucleotidyltransferase with HDIG domain